MNGNGYSQLEEPSEDDDPSQNDGGAPGSPTPSMARSHSSYSLGDDDHGRSPLDELASFFEAQLEKRNPAAAARAKELRKKMSKINLKVEIHRDKKKAAEIETIEFLPQDSTVYRGWLQTQPLTRVWDRWTMMFMVGAVVGTVAWMLHEFFASLGEWKTDKMREIISENVGLAWLFNIAFSCALVALSAASVLFLSPAAAGSGVPDVMAYLNGCMLPRMFEWRTAAIKFISCGLCVGAGLPVGPEGPMIFLGAALGGLVSQGTVSTKLLNRVDALRSNLDIAVGSLGRLWPFKRFRNTSDQRDFMTAGCAAGVAAAFGSPVGGLLFVMEDVASFWKVTLGWEIFFACMTAVFARAFMESLGAGEVTGLFNNTVAYATTKQVNTHILAMAIAMFVGATNGALAALFTTLNLKLTTLRAHYVGPVRWKRLLEPVVYMFIFATLSIVMPYAFPCRESDCFTDVNGQVMCTNSTDLGMSEEGNMLVIEMSAETFTCREDFSLADVLRGTQVAGNVTGVLGIGTGVRRYNELATLMHVPGSTALKHMLARGVPHEFGYGSIITFFIIYYLGAAITAGTCLASGLFVPMLVMGSCIGRFWGLVALDIATHIGMTQEQLNGEVWSWIDPGVFAMVGAGAYMAGVSRLTLSLAVIVMEMTNEVHFLLPILLGIMTAKWTADLLEHPLYHALLEFKNVPFLLADPPGGQALEMLSVADVMRPAPIQCVREQESLVAATNLLRTTKFHAFPVVRAAANGEGDVLVGIITRDHLTVVLMHAALAQSNQASTTELSYDMLLGRVDLKGQEIAQAHANAGAEGEREMKLLENGQAGGLPQSEIDLRPYVNRSDISVPAHFSAMRAYILFRTLGLRHMPVVDELNRVVGLITRKELLSEALVEKMHAAGVHVGGH